MKLQSFALHNYKQIPQISKLTKEQIKAIEVVGNVLPFKTNNYVVNELIDWDNLATDPIFKLTFPQKGMLSVENEQYVGFISKSSLLTKYRSHLIRTSTD